MKIAQLAPLAVTVPPVGYGGTERVISVLTEELVRRGHDVTLFAAGGSRTRARLKVASPRPLWDMGVVNPMAYMVAEVEEVVAASRDFDVIHSHLDLLPWLAADRVQAPVVTTLHGRLDSPELARAFMRYPRQPLVSISEAQRRPLKNLDLNWAATVYHGLSLEATYPLGGGGGYLVFLGRVTPEKDPVSAIRVAIKAGMRLKIAARVDPVDIEYFKSQVQPLLTHPLIEWVGEIGDRDKAELLGHARALLLPIDWPEPFGLVFIEALANGTPIVSRPRGAVPELIVPGRHGFLGESDDELVEACRQVERLDRRECREWALSHFSVERMVDGYEAVYEAVARRARPELQVASPRLA